MDDQKMEVISQLMEELQDLMGYSSDELGDRLGRPKVEVEMSSEPMDEGEMPEDDIGGEDGDDEMDPDAKLKSRLLKMRG